MFAHEFMRNAFLAGSTIALACGLVGYFVVLRSQVFAGDAFSHVAFTGALAAAAAGIDIRLGLFAATILVAVGLGALGERSRADDVVIGSVFAWILGLGVLFLSIFTVECQRLKWDGGRARPVRLDLRPQRRRRSSCERDRAGERPRPVGDRAAAPLLLRRSRSRPRRGGSGPSPRGLPS